MNKRTLPCCGPLVLTDLSPPPPPGCTTCSPVVRAETLRFKEDGVFRVVKDVFLPWYNAYR